MIPSNIQDFSQDKAQDFALLVYKQQAISIRKNLPSEVHPTWNTWIDNEDENSLDHAIWSIKKSFGGDLQFLDEYISNYKTRVKHHIETLVKCCYSDDISKEFRLITDSEWVTNLNEHTV